MEFIDMHCDTLAALFFKNLTEDSLYRCDRTMVDFSRMQAAGQLAQFFAVFMPPQGGYAHLGGRQVEDEAYIQALHSLLLAGVDKYADCIRMAYSAEDIRSNRAAGKMSALLTMEDGRAVDGKMENLKRFYEMGFRAIALTWNSANCFGAPNSPDPAVMQTGLTAFGREAVDYMQQLGILVDVSHLSEGGFYDVADICKKPFIATHSNCRGSLCPHPRGLTDDQLRVLANAGGVTGLNFCPEFLTPDITCKNSTAAAIAKHARHMADVGGVDCVALGTDFDGIGGNLEIGDAAKMYLLEDALKKEGFAHYDIEKIFYKNVLRVMEDAL